jgi:CRISPR-associated protein Csd1
MILNELVGYYRRKAAADPNAIAPVGWIRRPIDYFVVLARDGSCIDIADNTVKTEKRQFAKVELVPSIGKQSLKHTNSGKDANLLWDSAAFALGYGAKGADKLGYFLAEIDRCFDGIDDEALTALRSFLISLHGSDVLTSLLRRFDLEAVFEKREPFVGFRWQPDGGVAIHHRPALIRAYEGTLVTPEGVPLGNCLISGEDGVPIALNETVIKGVRGAQSSGANIVSYNKRSFESYGKRERAGENSPISSEASFAYTTALNQLLRFDSPQKLQVGDATTVFWADGESSLENDFAAMFDEPRKEDADPDRGTRAVATLLESARQGVGPVLDSKTRFFVLGLAAPSLARITVRFWHAGTVAEMAGRIVRHFTDLEIDHHPDAKPYLSIKALLTATATQGDTDNISPNLGGEVMRAILEGLPYPETIFSGAVRRIRAEQSKKDKRTGKLVMNVTYPRAAILKACLNRKRIPFEKEITVSLDKENTSPGYRLGRLFAVLERIQEEASPNLNATIRDRYYGAFSATPATVFATLMRMKNHHLAKLDNPGRRVNLEKLVGEIVDGLTPTLPSHLPLADQGRFAIGYYHQRQDFFAKREVTAVQQTSTAKE